MLQEVTFEDDSMLLDFQKQCSLVAEADLPNCEIVKDGRQFKVQKSGGWWGLPHFLGGSQPSLAHMRELVDKLRQAHKHHPVDGVDQLTVTQKLQRILAGQQPKVPQEKKAQEDFEAAYTNLTFHQLTLYKDYTAALAKRVQGTTIATQDEALRFVASIREEIRTLVQFQRALTATFVKEARKLENRYYDDFQSAITALLAEFSKKVRSTEYFRNAPPMIRDILPSFNEFTAKFSEVIMRNLLALRILSDKDLQPFEDAISLFQQNPLQYHERLQQVLSDNEKLLQLDETKNIALNLENWFLEYVTNPQAVLKVECADLPKKEFDLQKYDHHPGIGLIRKWISYIPDIRVVQNTFARETLSAIQVNGVSINARSNGRQISDASDSLFEVVCFCENILAMALGKHPIFNQREPFGRAIGEAAMRAAVEFATYDLQKAWSVLKILRPEREISLKDDQEFTRRVPCRYDFCLSIGINGELVMCVHTFRAFNFVNKATSETTPIKIVAKSEKTFGQVPSKWTVTISHYVPPKP